MAKKIVKNVKPSELKASKPGFGFNKISEMIHDISKKTAITIENDSEKRTYISTGIHILDGLLAKSILHGGVSKNRITIFAGEPQTGKSYILYGIARNAQKEGYNVIYIDTEYSIELNDLEELGLDISPERLMLIRSNRVEDLKVSITQLLNKLKEEKLKGVDIGKTIILLDSIGQLASSKEIEDAIAGKDKSDMTRAKVIKSLFRIISSDLGYLGIPLVASNHVYMSMDLFPKAIMSGGKGGEYSASSIVFLSIAKLKTGEEETDHSVVVSDLGQSGVVITAKSIKNRIAKPMKVKFELNHTSGTNPYKGLEFFLTKDNFEKTGIAKVKPIVNKSTGEITYESGTKWYVKHLDKTFYEKQLHQPKIFTKEVLESLEKIVEKYFSYSTHEEQVEAMKKMDEVFTEKENDTDFDIDNDNDDALFS